MKDSFKFKPRSISVDDLSNHMTVYAHIPYDETLTISQIEEQLVTKAKSKLKTIAEFI